ncbi:rhodanese-like domain-containing protein [Paenibacillus sp. MBLB4367]|uniref:rhodanese-like domain-containing protein n=1 Tax=Paenibacillus sp. MBLB4367 TaxID=3384767 RepID=UPI0039081E23
MAELIEGISHLDAKELQAIVADPANPVVVIDVREPEEYTEAHIAGLPLIPMGDIIDIVDQLDKSKEYVFVCRSGRRSFEVAKFFRAQGFEQVHNFKGGMLDWQEQGHEIAAGEDHIIETFSPEQLERKRS